MLHYYFGRNTSITKSKQLGMTSVTAFRNFSYNMDKSFWMKNNCFSLNQLLIQTTEIL